LKNIELVHKIINVKNKLTHYWVIDGAN
jgi:hypothetical protein